MSLPTFWLDRIFDKLTLTYGQEFLRRWQDIDLNSVKSDWAHELSGFEHHPKAIAWALQNLPPKPPTVLEFRSIARKAPDEEAPRLEAPVADRARVMAEFAKMAPSRSAAYVDKKDWARRIMARHDAGDSLRPICVKFAMQALRIKDEVEEA